MAITKIPSNPPQVTSAHSEDRLARFNQVQNTYLSIFLALGGLGLILGSAGLAVIVARNVLDRRAELALLKTTGFKDRSIQWLVLSEHWLLLLAGTLIGLVSAAIAVLPSLSSRDVAAPREFERLLRRLLAKDPDERPASAEDLLRLIDQVESPHSQSTRSRRVRARRRGHSRSGSGGGGVVWLLVLAAVAIGAFVAWRQLK